MAFTREQLRARNDWIGSSDVPTILGVNRYQNLGDLYLIKTGQTEPDTSTSAAAEWGNRLEPIVAQWVSERVGSPWVSGEYRRSQDGLLRAQLDGWMPDVHQHIEVKTAGLLNPFFRADEEGWGRDGTDEVPYNVLAQTQFAMMLAGSTITHVGAFLGGTGPRHYVIPALPELQEAIRERCYAFWNDHVLAGVPPEDVPSLDTLRLVQREPLKSIEIDGNLIDRYRAIKEQADLITKAADHVKAEILTAMGDAEQGVSPMGTVTYTANSRGYRTFRVKG